MMIEYNGDKCEIFYDQLSKSAPGGIVFFTGDSTNTPHPTYYQEPTIEQIEKELNRVFFIPGNNEAFTEHINYCTNVLKLALYELVNEW